MKQLAISAVLALSVFSTVFAEAGFPSETLEQAMARLRYAYRDFSVESQAHTDSVPFTVQASREDGTVESLALFLLEGVEFDDLVRVLATPQGWCESLLLHLNVKTCIHRDEDLDQLELYLGRKHYQHPSESMFIVFDFETEARPDALHVTLTAEEGPYGTSEYVFIFNALRVPEGVFVELRLSNEEGYAGKLADLYFSTLGRSKVGFTQVGETIFGNPKFVSGQVGAAERNVVRYMYALRVSLKYINEPFARRAEAWFEATERHPEQLRELKRQNYLQIKEREYENQVAYQQAADRGETITIEEPTKNR